MSESFRARALPTRPPPTVEVLADPDAACRAVAARIADAAAYAIAARGHFAMAVSGGASPIPVFRLLAGELHDRVLWPAVHAWLNDERCVPPDHAESNWGMLRRELLDHVEVPPAQRHRFEGELPAAEAAHRAEVALRRYAADRAVDTLFDVVLLGVGDDGHTASLFPDGPELEERTRLVVPSRAPEGVTIRDRVTMTIPALESTREVIVLAYGREKREPMRAALERRVPAGLAWGEERTTWIVDRAAGA